jgi:retron-type reverse transcriptase
MTKKLITLNIEQKSFKINFADVKKVFSRKPRKCPKIPVYNQGWDKAES